MARTPKTVERTPAQIRSDTMRAVKGRDTGPERAVRAMLRRFAPGYRLDRRELPGSPDIAYLGRKQAIFVHGCFWHGHGCARGGRAPKANAEYWSAKIARNMARDAAAREALAAMGWSVLTLWECELKRGDLETRLRRFACEGGENDRA